MAVFSNTTPALSTPLSTDDEPLRAARRDTDSALTSLVELIALASFLAFGAFAISLAALLS